MFWSGSRGWEIEVRAVPASYIRPGLNTKFKNRVRRMIQRTGFDVVRYPLASPLARTVRLLDRYGVACVVDVGANDGGFATAIRHLGYSRQIVSFEPLRSPYEVLSRKAAADADWQALQLAVGDRRDTVSINVSGNNGLSSSMLPMLDTHTDAAPDSHYIGVESVRQDRLDSLLPELGIKPNSRTFLKVDVQGYERAVLDGAMRLFQDKAFVGLQLELSLVPLYRGAMTYREGLDFAEGQGMTLMGLDPVFADPDSGQLLQVDAVFFGHPPRR